LGHTKSSIDPTVIRTERGLQRPDYLTSIWSVTHPKRGLSPKLTLSDQKCAGAVAFEADGGQRAARQTKAELE
jgi:hypothetical protein